MAIKARDQVTISIGVDVASVDTYYKLQASTAAVPQKPTTASPSGWSTTEPGYDGTTTNTLYTCQKTTLTDGTFYWGAVSKSSSYEAAKQAANGVNSLSQTVTTLSNNYATFKQETETFESTVGTTYAKKVEIDELVSRGEQLVVNGNLFMGDATNFSSRFIFDGSMANGTKGSVTQIPSSAAIVINMVDYFPIDANGDYYCSLDVIRDNSGSGKAFLFAYLDYRDVDKNTINYQHWHSMKTNGDTLTQLAQDLKSGDTKIYLNDVSKYVANNNAGTGNQLIVWDWVNGFGYAWPPNTYSRHFAGSWTRNDSSVFNLSENSITLTSAYSGVTIPAGTWVSQRQDGGTYQYFCSGWVPDTWTTWGHVVGASYTDGGGYSIPCGAAEARVGFLWNHTDGGATANQAQIWATNISVTKMGAIDNKLGTEISQRKAQFGVCTTAAGTAAKAVELADFSLYKGAQIAVRFNSGNTAGSPTLNVNNTGARQIVVNGSAFPAAKYVTWNTYANCTFVYDGIYWRFTGSDQDMVKTVDVESRVSTAETSITQNRNNITLKANASDVYTKTQTDGLISTEVENRNSAIEQSAAAINLSVSQNYTTKTEFNNLEIGGRNLWIASRITSSTGNPTTANGLTFEWNSDTYEYHVYGTNSKTNTAWGRFDGYLWPAISYLKCEPGDVLTLSVDGDDIASQGLYVAINAYISGSTSQYGAIYTGSTKSYITVTLPDKHDSTKAFSDAFIGVTAGAREVDATFKIKLEKGNKPTDWTPAPEDIEAYADIQISAAKAEIKVTTDGISSTVSKINSVKYVTAAATSWPLASIKTYAAEGHSESWGVNSTDGLRVGDTVYVKGTDGTRNCTVYIKTTVTAISSSTIFTGVSHGYEDVLPVDTIKSTINQSSDSVKIQAKHVEIDGAAIFSNTAFRQAADAVYASYANMGFQFKKDIIIYGDSDKYYPVYLNNNQAEYSQSVPHEVVVTRGYSEQAPADWNTSTHKGDLNLRLRWNYGGWGGAKYVCQIYDFSELYSNMLGDVLVGNKSGMNSTIYLRGGGTTGAIYHIYSQVSIENTRYGATFPYIGTDEPGTVYMQSGSYTFTVDNPLTTPNTEHILSLAATVDEQYIYISKASGTTSVASTTTWVTAYTDSQNAWTTKRPTYNSSYPVLFVAKQRKTAFGLVTCTTPVKDDTTTVIDGGHITTGTIDTNRLNADTIRSNIVQTTDIQASRVMMMSGEQTQSLEAYRESVSNNIGEMVSNETFQQKIQALDEALEEKLSQEDVDTLVNTAISDVEESIANNYVANSDLDDAVRTLNDTLSNLGMTYATTKALSKLSDSLNITSQDLIQLTSYIYADNVDDGAGGTVPVLFLGSKQSKVQAMLSNNVLNFIYRANPDDPGTVVAYIGAEETDTNATGKLYVIEAVVVNEISFGHWSFFERQNHNMAIKWIGE